MPVFSVVDADEAERLIALTCATTYSGQPYARELVEEQTMANLAAFSDRLDRAHQLMKQNGNCHCEDGPGGNQT